MSLPSPFLTDFGLRLACGLVAWSALINWRSIPVAFFRTQCLVALGLYVMAMLAGWSAIADTTTKTIWISLAVSAYFGSVCWGIGLPHVGRWLCGIMALISLGLLAISGNQELGPFEAAARCASALWLGSTLTAMLLGHYYLTSPAMSIEPLKTLISGMFLFLGIRLLTTILPFIFENNLDLMQIDRFSSLWLAMRVLMGYLGVFVATYLSYRTAAIRSTQSATGILYIALALLLFGELTAMLLGRSMHLII